MYVVMVMLHVSFEYRWLGGLSKVLWLLLWTQGPTALCQKPHLSITQENAL